MALTSEFYSGWIEALLVSEADRLAHHFRDALDSSKALKALQWDPEMSFEMGLEKTILRYQESRAWVDSARR